MVDDDDYLGAGDEGLKFGALVLAGGDGVGMMASSAGPEPPKPVAFIADHPFLFAIEEKTTGTILFMGSYK